jgi:Peptidase family M23
MIASSAVSIVWLDVQPEDKADIPRRVEHRLVGSFLPSLAGQASSLDVVVARIQTNRKAPVGLGLPVGEGIWLASEGCCSDDTHHRRGVGAVNGDLAVPQRFAIDWFRLDDQHRAWVGDPTKLSSYLSYGEPVIAAADGTVVDALDGLPDSQPPHTPPLPPIEETVGNHVVQQIGPGVFLLYAHLKPGSVRVNAGQSVRRGQVLGQIGTSGNSTTPHLHFQVMTTPTFFPTDSPPYVFERFDLIGQVTQRIWDDNMGLQPTGVLPFAPAQPPTRHQLEMPLDRDVIVFSASADRRIPTPRHGR